MEKLKITAICAVVLFVFTGCAGINFSDDAADTSRESLDRILNSTVTVMTVNYYSLDTANGGTFGISLTNLGRGLMYRDAKGRHLLTVNHVVCSEEADTIMYYNVQLKRKKQRVFAVSDWAVFFDLKEKISELTMAPAGERGPRPKNISGDEFDKIFIELADDFNVPGVTEITNCAVNGDYTKDSAVVGLTGQNLDSFTYLESGNFYFEKFSLGQEVMVYGMPGGQMELLREGIISSIYGFNIDALDPEKTAVLDSDFLFVSIGGMGGDSGSPIIIRDEKGIYKVAGFTSMAMRQGPVLLSFVTSRAFFKITGLTP